MFIYTGGSKIGMIYLFPYKPIYVEYSQGLDYLMEFQIHNKLKFVLCACAGHRSCIIFKMYVFGLLSLLLSEKLLLGNLTHTQNKLFGENEKLQ
jgi:hypothetical protein